MGVKGRARHVAKWLLRIGYTQVSQRLVLKVWVINILHKFGYYLQARQLYHHLFPLFSSEPNKDTAGNT
ncbi:MAG: hypothetical protein HNEKOMLI_00253 [Sodalis sp. Psp]|nr:hypothetical protein [Sodalis sp. Psp]MCR3756750.1 hypothetical protein [Sodalis sp. Ppy]